MISEPIVTVECDGNGCTYKEEFGLTTTARGYDERNLNREIESAGWTIVDDNTHLCSSCSEGAK